jgi:hypothetical protein
MFTLAEALRALDVRVDVIADIDIIQEESALERLVKALGGDWEAVATNARRLKIAIEQRRPGLTSEEVTRQIRAILDRAPLHGTTEFPRNLRSEIEGIFRKASPWEAIKDAGSTAIPSGQPTNHFEQLQATCNSHGLLIVPVGELEGFRKSEGVRANG